MISKKYTSLSHIQEDLAKDKTSCVELAGYYIAQNKKHAGLNAVLEVFEEETLENASRNGSRPWCIFNHSLQLSVCGCYRF